MLADELDLSIMMLGLTEPQVIDHTSFNGRLGVAVEVPIECRPHAPNIRQWYRVSIELHVWERLHTSVAFQPREAFQAGKFLVASSNHV